MSKILAVTLVQFVLVILAGVNSSIEIPLVCNIPPVEARAGTGFPRDVPRAEASEAEQARGTSRGKPVPARASTGGKTF